ncbi:hypothetical protein ACFE04_011213 [Oxalis oulophora]
MATTINMKKRKAENENPEQPPTAATPIPTTSLSREERQKISRNMKCQAIEDAVAAHDYDTFNKILKYARDDCIAGIEKGRGHVVQGKECLVKIKNLLAEAKEILKKAKNGTTGGLGPFGGDVAMEEKDNDRAITYGYCKVSSFMGLVLMLKFLPFCKDFLGLVCFSRKSLGKISEGTQCNSFKTRAAQVKEGLENAVPGITVVLNPKKRVYDFDSLEPRKGCFEISEEGGEKFISLLDLKRPFKPKKDLDMEKVISDIVEKLK